ncbi:hypothetical protein HK096_010986, partial [Nowakowskiella sp. JEL0078]
MKDYAIYQFPSTLRKAFLPIFRKNILSGKVKGTMVLLTDKEIGSDIVDIIFEVLQSHEPKDQIIIDMKAEVQNFALLYQADPDKCSIPKNLSWILLQDEMEWSGITLQVKNEAFLHCLPSLMRRSTIGLYGSSFAMKLGQIVETTNGMIKFVEYFDDFLKILKENPATFFGGTFYSFWESLLKSERLVLLLSKNLNDLISFIPSITEFLIFPKVLNVTLRKSGDISCALSSNTIEAIEISIGVCFQQPIEYSPGGYINFLSFVGETSEEVAKLVIESLLRVVQTLEPTSTFSVFRALFIGESLNAIKGISEKIKPSILTPYVKIFESLAK